jgi:hypothetical protein
MEASERADESGEEPPPIIPRIIIHIIAPMKSIIGIAARSHQPLPCIPQPSARGTVSAMFTVSPPFVRSCV